MEIALYSQEGKEVSKIALPKEFFEAPIKKDLLHRALLMQLSNARRPIAHTKTRSERAGSTKKLTRQKGLGRARKGPARSPVMRKGGVAFGPRNTANFTKDLSKNERRGALLSALSEKAKGNSILALEKYEGKIGTKPFATLLKKIGLDRKVLLVLPEKNQVIQKSAHNISEVTTILVNYLNVRDLLNAKHVLFLQTALDKLPTIFK
jgi:large subunit ribosomal protein L4